jgi:hypothetical protein
MAHDEPDDRTGDGFDDRSGLLPPDGVAWPPEPAPIVPVPRPPDVLPTTARRPADADIADWRTMPIEAPDGYRGSSTAPTRPTAGTEPWSIASLLLAIAGLLPLLWRVPLVSLLAVAFGLVGRRVCSLDPARPGKVLATLGVIIGGATLIGIAGAVAAGRLTLFG